MTLLAIPGGPFPYPIGDSGSMVNYFPLTTTNSTGSSSSEEDQNLSQDFLTHKLKIVYGKIIDNTTNIIWGIK